jgi:PAS domain S-box-containing protein
MIEVKRELDFYKQQCNELGKQILGLQKENTRARRDIRRSRVLGKLIAQAHRYTNASVPKAELGVKYLEIILGTLNVDRAILMYYSRKEKAFLPKYALGFDTNISGILKFPEIPPDFLFANSRSRIDPALESLQNFMGAPHLLWAFNETEGIALSLGNKVEDNNLNIPFEAKDREIAEGALNLFIDITERKKAEETLNRKDSILEAVGFAAEQFMKNPFWENYIQHIIQRLGLATGSGAISILKATFGTPGLSNQEHYFEWSNEKHLNHDLPKPGVTYSLIQQVFAKFEEELRRGETIQYRLDYADGEAGNILHPSGYHSCIMIPIFSGKEWWGLMAILEINRDRVWSSTETEALKLAAGTFGAMIQRNEIEASLKEKEEKYRLIAENISDIVWTTGTDLEPTYISPSIELILGYSAEEAMSLSLEEILTPPSRERITKYIQRALTRNYQIGNNGDWPVTLEVELMDKKGSIVPCEATHLPLLEDDGNLIGMIGVTRDISERKRTEKELVKAKDLAERANAAKTNFLANMSHELRTPLNHIIGFTELIVDGNFGDLNDTQEEYLTDVLESSKHLLSLINDILDLSRIESGKLELELSQVNLRSLLEDSLIMIKQKAINNGISVLTALNGIPEYIHADERKLKQIMYNLLSNAVKFSLDGGQILLTADLVDGSPSFLSACSESRSSAKNQIALAQGLKATEKCIRISVADTGIGVKKADLGRIFRPFVQVENIYSRKHQGTGLGLSLTKSLAELHGGRIWAESEGEGKGSIFHFTIPVTRIQCLSEHSKFLKSREHDKEENIA